MLHSHILNYRHFVLQARFLINMESRELLTSALEVNQEETVTFLVTVENEDGIELMFDISQGIVDSYHGDVVVIESDHKTKNHNASAITTDNCEEESSPFTLHTSMVEELFSTNVCSGVTSYKSDLNTTIVNNNEVIKGLYYSNNCCTATQIQKIIFYSRWLFKTEPMSYLVLQLPVIPSAISPLLKFLTTPIWLSWNHLKVLVKGQYLQSQITHQILLNNVKSFQILVPHQPHCKQWITTKEILHQFQNLLGDVIEAL